MRLLSRFSQGCKPDSATTRPANRAQVQSHPRKTPIDRRILTARKLYQYAYIAFSRSSVYSTINTKERRSTRSTRSSAQKLITQHRTSKHLYSARIWVRRRSEGMQSQNDHRLEPNDIRNILCSSRWPFVSRKRMHFKAYPRTSDR